MKVYDKGDSPFITLRNQVYTFATDTWADADADSNYPKITITDPAGVVKVNDASMTDTGTAGKYTYIYQLATDATPGRWTGVIRTCNSGYYDYEKFGFIVS
jgi:hypothetical protein